MFRLLEITRSDPSGTGSTFPLLRQSKSIGFASRLPSHYEEKTKPKNPAYTTDFKSNHTARLQDDGFCTRVLKIEGEPL